MYEPLREAFIRRMTVDSPHRDRRRKDYNQAIFMPGGGASWSSIDLSMVMAAFDKAVKDMENAVRDLTKKMGEQ